MIMLLIVLLIIIDAAVSGKSGAGVHDLLLDQVDGHGEDGQAEQHIDDAAQQLVLAVRGVHVGDGVAGDKVTEADGGQGDESKVESF